MSEKKLLKKEEALKDVSGGYAPPEYDHLATNFRIAGEGNVMFEGSKRDLDRIDIPVDTGDKGEK